MPRTLPRRSLVSLRQRRRKSDQRCQWQKHPRRRRRQRQKRPEAPTRKIRRQVKSDAKEEEDTRKEVLTRVDLMHNLSNKEKDELYAQIERARGFTKIALIPFQSGRTAPGSAQIEDLAKRIQDPEVQKLLSDPTVALIFVGYADTQGDQASNLEISRTRAETVQKMVSTRLKLANLMHSVGMGGQELFDKTNREKNRVVEVWAVQP